MFISLTTRFVAGSSRQALLALAIAPLLYLTACAPAELYSHSATTETLIWSDEFTSGQAQSLPNPGNWAYVTGNGSGGLQVYCAYGSSASPCNASQPNSWVGSDGYLHIVSRMDTGGNYTSAFLQTKALQTFQYGRMEARIKLPAGQGMWPAFWMLGSDISTVSWPKCGEMDIMENIGKDPSTNFGSLHGFTTASVNGYNYSNTFVLPSGALSDDFHVYGVIWSQGSVQYYLDDPSNIFASFTPATLGAGETWPFDDGKFYFVLNNAIGGSWGGNPDSTTKWPAEMLVDYVRVYQTKSTTVVTPSR